MELEKKNKNGTFRWWMLTWNNPSEDWKKDLSSFQADYAIGQLEKGEQETIHIQGCLYFTKAIRATHFKDFPCWLKGISTRDAENVIRYCKKNQTRLDGPFECGEAPKSIRETKDWDLAKELAITGRLKEVQSSILIPHFTNLQKISGYFTKPCQTADVRGVWIYGPPGAGKSHYARENFGIPYIKAQNKWFDGYMGEQTIILDDFDESGKVLGHYLKIWADKWPCYGEIKGATVPLSHTRFIITSNYVPSDFWSDQMLEAITRRFEFIDMSQFIKGMKQNSYLSFLRDDNIIEF